MIGKKFYKNDYSEDDYAKCAEWCNDTQSAYIEDMGEYYECIAIPALTLEEVKNSKLDALSSAFDKASANAHCTSSLGFEINADETADRNIRSLITVTPDDASVMFCDYNNEFHSITKADMQTMLVEVIANGLELYQKKWGLRTAIESATTIEEVDAVEIAF